MSLTITHNENHEPLWGGLPLTQTVESQSFTEMLFRLLGERKPSAKELELFELLLKLSIDHGPDTPSAKVTIASAKGGRAMGEAVGKGIAEINEVHGGATAGAMQLFYDIAEKKQTVESTVASILAEKKRVPGFGHRLYKKDPRAELILETALRLGFPKKYHAVVEKLETALAKHLPGKTLPLNIDGAIALALCSLEWKAELSTALFIVARSAGLSAHYLQTAQTPK